MDTKKIIVWVIVVALIGVAAYFVLKNYSGAPQPADTTAAGAGTAPADASAAAEQVQGQEVKIGTGDEAKPGMEVSVEYTGKLADGTVFDTNVGKAPLVFILGAQGIIPGFQIGVNGMKVGGERLIAVPPSLGYGAQAVGTIPANSTLIFSVKLLKVTAAPAN